METPDPFDTIGMLEADPFDGIGTVEDVDPFDAIGTVDRVDEVDPFDDAGSPASQPPSLTPDDAEKQLDILARAEPDKFIPLALTQAFGKEKFERFKWHDDKGRSFSTKYPSITDAAGLQELRKFKQLGKMLEFRWKHTDEQIKAIRQRTADTAALMSAGVDPFAADDPLAEMREHVKSMDATYGAAARELAQPLLASIGLVQGAAPTAAGAVTAAGAGALGTRLMGPVGGIVTGAVTGLAVGKGVHHVMDSAPADGLTNDPTVQAAKPVGEIGALVGLGGAGAAGLIRGGMTMKAAKGIPAAVGWVSKRVGIGAGVGLGFDAALHAGSEVLGYDEGDYTAKRGLMAATLGALTSGLGIKVRNLPGDNVGQIVASVAKEAELHAAVAAEKAAKWGGKPKPAKLGTMLDEKGKPVNSAADIEVFRAAGERLAAMKAKGDTFIPDAEAFRFNVRQALQGESPIGAAAVETGPIVPSGRSRVGGLYGPDGTTLAAPTPGASSATPTQPASQPATPAPAKSTVSGVVTSTPVVIPPGGVVEGAQTVVFGAKGSQFPARYVWASTGATQTSHAGEMMGPNPAYPLANTRDYSSPEERDKQLDTRNNFDPRRHVTDAPDASTGPRMAATIIGEDGVPVRTTLGGNNRGWAIANLPAEKRAELRALENAKAANFGLAPTSDPDAELQRDLGTFDLRTPGERERLQGIVDQLNPSPGMVQAHAKRAELDAQTVPPSMLDGMDMTVSPGDSQAFVRSLISGGQIDRNLAGSLAENPSAAQDYTRRLLTNAAFRTPALAETRMDARGAGGAIHGMLDAAIPSLLRLRGLGDDGHTAADAVARTFNTVLRTGAKTIQDALDTAARQTEFDPASIVSRVIAQGLQAAIVPDAKGRPLAEPTAANARTLFGLIDRTVRNWQVEQQHAGDLLGGRNESVGDAVIRAVTHFVDKGLASASEGSKSKPSVAITKIKSAVPPPTLPHNPIREMFDWYEKNLVGKTFTSPLGETMTFKPGHFFRLVAAKVGVKKGFIEGYETAADAMQAIRDGKIESFPGYQHRRAQWMAYAPQLIEAPDLILSTNEKPEKRVHIKRFSKGGTQDFVVAGFVEGKEFQLTTFHARELKAAWLDSHTVLWEKDASSSPDQLAFPGGLLTGSDTAESTGTNPQPPEIVNDSPLVFAAKGSPYAAVPLANLPNIKAIEMPELRELVRELTGRDVDLKTMAKALGQFADGLVRLNPRIFQDPVLATKVLAHEIGHLIDYLPDHTLRRGNLWGRLHSLRKFMMERWTSTGPTNTELRAELIAVTEWWKPIDRLNSPASYVRYRESGVELYADFISVLFNSPADAKRLAPKFFRNFFVGLGSKPEAKAALFELQNWLNRPFMTRQADRRVRVDEMMALGEEAFLRKFEERKQRYAGFSGLVSRLKQGFFDSNSPIRDRAKSVPHTKEAQLVEMLFDSHPMSRNEHWRWLERMGRTVVEPLEAAGFSLDDLGAHLFFDRIANESYQLSERQAKELGFETGGRSVIANPGGHTAVTARQALLAERLRNGLSRQTLLERGVQKFHDEVYDVMREARKVGLFTADQMALIEGNRDHYAAFVPLEYLDTFVPAGIMQQTGTMKDIASPFLTTLLKALTLQRAIQFQRLKAATVDLLKTNFSAEIRLAETRMSPGGRTTPVPTREVGWAQISLREDGKPVWYNVPKEIALMFEHTPLPLLDGAMELLSVPFRKVFYPMLITYNPVFQLVTNPLRDARRNALTRPLGIGWGAVLRQLPLVKQIGENPALDAVRALVKRGEQEPIIAEMLDNLAIVPGEATFSATAGVATTSFEKILQDHGLLPADEQSRWLPSRWPVLGKVLQAIQTAGRMNELLPKVDTYRRLRVLGWSPQEAAMFVRNATGTPNFGRKGKHANIPGAIFPFFNIWTKAWATDAQLASKGWKRTSRPGGTSAAAWWMRWALLSGVPRVMKIAGGLGLLGAGVKQLFDGIGDHDKKNYDVIPVGYVGASEVNPEGKVAYIRVPKDPTDRLITGMFDNLLTSSATALAKQGAFGEGIATLNANAQISLTGTLAANLGIVDADVPGLNPLIKIGEGWKAYLGGQNPFDDFRDRHVLSEDEHLAGGLEANKTMLAWTLGQMGTQSFFRYNPRSETTTEIAIDNTPVVNGFLKVTDYGYRQQQEAAQTADKMPKAEERLDLPSEVRTLRQEFTYLQSLGAKLRTHAQTQRYETLKSWDKGVYQVGFEQLLNSEDADEKTNVRARMRLQSESFKR